MILLLRLKFLARTTQSAYPMMANYLLQPGTAAQVRTRRNMIRKLI
jgi:hypothetical protein